MFQLTKRVLKHITTERDGQSYDVTKVLWVIGTLIFFGLVVFTTIVNPASFNIINFGIGFGSVLVAGSGGVKIKESNEQIVPTPNGGIDKTKTSEDKQ